MDAKTWSTNKLNTIGGVKHWLSKMSLSVRGEQLDLLNNIYDIKPKAKVIDIGTSPNEDLPDTNFFEKYFKYPQQVTAISVEDCSNLKKKYPKIKFKMVLANSKLPFRNAYFDLAVSWATLEHVGDYKKQELFLNQALRVGKHVFVTTPYRLSPYEPHTGLPFVQWLPLDVFRLICKWLHKDFWATSANLNPLYISDIQRMKLIRPVKIYVYKTFGFIPSHLIIFG